MSDPRARLRQDLGSMSSGYKWLSGGPNETGVWPNEWLARELYEANMSALFMQNGIEHTDIKAWVTLSSVEHDRWAYIAGKALQRIQASQRDWWLRDWTAA